MDLVSQLGEPDTMSAQSLHDVLLPQDGWAIQRVEHMSDAELYTAATDAIHQHNTQLTRLLCVAIALRIRARGLAPLRDG